MARGPVRSSNDSANNWAAAMGSPNTAAKYTQGVNKVTTSPTAAAAAPDAQQRYMQNTQAAVSSGRMAAKLNAVSLQQWQAATSQRGAAGLAAGASKAKAKVQAAHTKLQPVWQAMRDAVSSLPKGGVNNAMARVQAALTVQAQMTGRQ